ncbi:hypothetical protein DKX38_014925 [Salix brachista]|uniref:S-locus receptor kinase C-terminal domain-containing protein n=1 Tax=Salix brachista TaxID=2182728 RepID=A0A5N5L420_9ROSI|nr:hypothetical protein DKX38_014925 [Salix brachista]
MPGLVCFEKEAEEKQYVFTPSKSNYSVVFDAITFSTLPANIDFMAKSKLQAWILFKQGRSAELAAKSKVEAQHISEALRSIHVGLLCVQENTEDRPNISHVVLMLGDEKELPQPQQPGFFTERDLLEVSYSSSQSKPPSADGCSISMLEAR